MPESIADQRARYPLAAYNFRVTVGDSAMSFTEVSGLAREYQTLTYKHGLSYWEGEDIAKFRYDKYVQVTLKKGLVTGVSVQTLYAWINSIQLNRVDKKDIYVRLCDETGAAVVSWKVINAFPTKLDAPGFTASSNDAAVESMELMADGVSIEQA